MQRDIKLGLAVGLFLLVLCGIFYIKMRSSGREEDQTAASGLETILVPEPSQDTRSAFDEDLPEAVKPRTAETDMSVKEQAATESLSTTPEVVATEEAKPNAIVRLLPPSQATAEKREKPEEMEEAKELPTLEVPPFPINPAEEKKPASVAATRGGGEYVVEPGDTLSAIASETLGSAKHWRKIYEANMDKLSAPEKLMVGMTLTIPEITEEESMPAPAKEPTLTPAQVPEAYEGEVHTVQKGETLSDIAERYLSDRNKWKQIAKLNPNINPDKLKIGQKIRIPQPE